MIIAAKVAEVRWKSAGKDVDQFWDAALVAIVTGIIGARIWHVMTDWHLYANNIITALYIWNGGLSIIGALAGGLLGIFFAVKRSKGSFTNRELSDAICVGLPFGQAFGRLGNWLNEELYGLPTNLPWKLYISEQNRVGGFEQYSYFHPLFAYEALLMLGLGVLLWQVSKKNASFNIGTGGCTLLYLAAYGWVRFSLEFLRIDKAVIGQTGLGVNQVVMLGLGVVCSIAVVIVQQRLYEKD